MTFEQKLRQAVTGSQSVLCVGLDPVLDRIPDSIKDENDTIEDIVIHFLKSVVETTSDYCCAYKPNLAFFEALGENGLNVFKQIVDYIPDNKIIIADAKRGDIGHTAASYKKAYFNTFDVDAITLSPFMGFDTLESFLDDESKAIYALTLTSNKGAEDFLLKPFQGYNMMSDYIAENLKSLSNRHPGHTGMVVGATKADILKEVINRHPHASLLIPGIGAQGGSVDDLEKAIELHPGIPLINSSRGIIYSGMGKNWQEDVEKAADKLKSKLFNITNRYV
jgi:orotidine-5'-phosphate decarboxylase